MASQLSLRLGSCEASLLTYLRQNLDQKPHISIILYQFQVSSFGAERPVQHY